MMRLLHRTIPTIAIASLVAAPSAWAQNRDDSTSTASAVVWLLGLGGSIVGFGSAPDREPRQNVRNCGGGCAGMSVRKATRFAPLGGFGSSTKAVLLTPSPAMPPMSPIATMAPVSILPKSSDLEYHARSLRSPHEQADLSDYGWSRRVDNDGGALAPVRSVSVEVVDTRGAADPDRSTQGPPHNPSPDGAGQAPRWVAPGSSPEAAPAAMSRESPTPASRSMTAAASGTALSGPLQFSDNPITTLAVPSANRIPLMTTVPEPSTVLLVAIGITSGLMIRSRRTNRR